MSIRIMTRVWETECPSLGAKLVLLALADNASDEGVAWPAIATIARKCSMSERTVSRHIVTLKKAGHLSISERSGTSNLYHVHPSSADHLEQNVASALVNPTLAREVDSHTRGDQSMTEPMTDCHDSPDNLSYPPMTECRDPHDILSSLPMTECRDPHDILSSLPMTECRDPHDILSSLPLTECHEPLTECHVTPDNLSPKPSRTVTEPRDSTLPGGVSLEISEEATALIEEILKAYPKSRGRNDARSCLFACWKAGEDLSAILEKVKAIAAVIESDYSEDQRVQFLPSAFSFFEGRQWEEDPADWRQADAIKRELATTSGDGGGWGKGRLNQ